MAVPTAFVLGADRGLAARAARGARLERSVRPRGRAGLVRTAGVARRGRASTSPSPAASRSAFYGRAARLGPSALRFDTAAVFEIGNSLREARMRRGIEFAQAEQATKIRGKYLRALEEERFELLPSETYVKGFLRTYADYLGLDGQLYVDEFNSRFVAGRARNRPRRSSARPQQREPPARDERRAARAAPRSRS